MLCLAIGVIIRIEHITVVTLIKMYWAKCRGKCLLVVIKHLEADVEFCGFALLCRRGKLDDAGFGR